MTAVAVPAMILQIAVVSPPCPLLRDFDYLPPLGTDVALLIPGVRLRIPFGRTTRIGVLLATATTPRITQPLSTALELLDPLPVLSLEVLSLLRWAADYYHYPIGEVVANALPVVLRTQKPSRGSNTPRKRRSSATTASLVQPLSDQAEPAPSLHPEQQAAVAAVAAVAEEGFQCFLLEGVTGSGKTEVYMEIVRRVLAQGRQALLLVPEIGLTPQFVDRLRRRLAVPLAVLHSGLADAARYAAWHAATQGEVAVILGTRSAIFTPLPRLGIIIVDEEHDLSFKQWEGFRYHARDLAVVRAQRAKIAVVLGSATPTLESLYNVQVGRYRSLVLRERAGDARPPAVRIVDLRGQSLYHGLAGPLLKVMETHLERGEQVLVFLNRRGYAPVLLCYQCGWTSECPRCDARQTFHREEWQLRCHHCGTQMPAPRVCPACHAVALHPLGAGTERLEHALTNRFPTYPLVRIDRDSTRRQGAMDRLLQEVHSGQARILIGTQMLAKGHDFPGVTLVVVVNTDRGLYGVDFRDSERFAQLLVQVAGRSGRAEKLGQVLLQTHHPDHPTLRLLLTGGYPAFAKTALVERAATGWPPYSALALLRAESMEQATALTFLQEAKARAMAMISAFAQNRSVVEIHGPLPSPMERRAERYRAQLLLQARRRADLQSLLNTWVPILETLTHRRGLQWSLDVDPMDLL